MPKPKLYTDVMLADAYQVTVHYKLSFSFTQYLMRCISDTVHAAENEGLPFDEVLTKAHAAIRNTDIEVIRKLLKLFYQ